MGSYLPVKQQQFLLAIPFVWPQRSDLDREAILPAFILRTVKTTMATAASEQTA
jgi:hypothetical protein